ncbi:MAG: tRNA 2-thiouridine(34) synthase MnmA [Pseudomonadota bacterium]
MGAPPGGSHAVVVAMSGGVDSAVAAALLVEAGYRVIGATLRLWDCEDAARPRACCSLEDTAAARDVADRLGFPFYVVDARGAFGEEVLRPAWDEIREGRTPNPCISCNEALKWGVLWRWAAARRASWIATGHHARVRQDGDGVRLLRGVDPGKDQSYYLFSLPPTALRRTLFPVGEMTKTEVRAHARALGLPVAAKADSQDFCFSDPGIPMGETLRRRFEGEIPRGEVVDPSGRILGTHAGVHRFTRGQRRGLGVALGRPAWVSRVDAKAGQVELTTRRDDLLTRRIDVTGVRWLGGAPDPTDVVEVQICSTGRPRPGQVVQLPDGCAAITLAEPAFAPTPGQAAVFYRGELVLGGGWISGFGGDGPAGDASPS